MARRTFFSFHYQSDIWRVWNVRNCWVVKEGDEISDGFFDSSVFEASQKESPDALKKFLREGLENSSVTCVLVDIDGVKNKDGKTTAKGANPLDQIGLYKTDNGIYFAELRNGKWIKYDDYTKTIPENELWFAAPTSKSVVPLSKHCFRYDYIEQDGRKNIGGWIETAAGLAGRV